MESILLITLFATFTIFLTIILYLLKDSKTKHLDSKKIPLALLSLSYLILSITLISWLLNFFIFTTTDLLIILSIILITQTICLITILYELNHEKKILYTLTPFLFLVPILISSPQSIHLAIPISLSITLLAFILAIPIQERLSKYIILYTTTTTLIYLISIYYKDISQLLLLFSTAIFTIFIKVFLDFIKLQSKLNVTKPRIKTTPLIHFLKHFVFIIIITNFIFVGTVSLHEFGHMTASSMSDCKKVKIVYEFNEFPHTQIDCKDIKQKNFWILGGILLPILLATFLFFSGGKFIKEISMQIVGFDLMISYLDTVALNLSKTIASIVVISGILLSTISLALLAKSRTED